MGAHPLPFGQGPRLDPQRRIGTCVGAHFVAVSRRAPVCQDNHCTGQSKLSSWSANHFHQLRWSQPFWLQLGSTIRPKFNVCKTSMCFMPGSNGCGRALWATSLPQGLPILGLRHAQLGNSDRLVCVCVCVCVWYTVNGEFAAGTLSSYLLHPG